MLSLEAVGMMFASLKAGGVREPYGNDGERREGMLLFKHMLGDLSDEQAMQAVTIFLRRPKSFFWPTPGQLLQCVQGSQEQRYEEAWARCMSAAHNRLGSPAHPECRTDPLRRYTKADKSDWVDVPAPVYKWEVDAATWRGIQACGGWRAFVEMQTSHIVAQRAAFRGAYEGANEVHRQQLEQRAAVALIEAKPMLSMVSK